MVDRIGAATLLILKSKPIRQILGRGPARSVVTRSRFANSFVRAMASDFEQYGLSAIKRVRSRYPAIYLKICAMMLPKEIQRVNEDAISRLSDEQLDEYLQIVRDLAEAKRAELRARGEPIDVTPAESKPKKGLRPVLIDDSKDKGELP